MSDIVYKYKNNLYINLTNRCPNDCDFCDIPAISRDLGVDLILDHEPNFAEVTKAIRQNISDILNEIVFCGGGEPLMRLDILLKVAKWIKSNYDHKIRLDTCGYPFIFYNGRKVVRELKSEGLDAVSVSINSTNTEDYNRVCHPKYDEAYQRSIEFVKDCKQVELKTRISFVDYHIDHDKCRQLAEKLGVDYIIRGYVNSV